jgi:pimeloyl-ACP methyl ester carboxylesterase
MQSVAHTVESEGWRLALHQTWSEEHIVPGRHPVVIIPGYGMNSFIFSYHPNGISLEGYLAAAGFEVWRADLRAQGGSVSTGGSGDFGLGELAVTDVGAVLRGVLERTRTGADRVDAIGASLGGSLLYAHMALVPDHRVGSLVAMGSPVRWVEIHPLVRLAFRSAWLAGVIPFKGTRRFAELALPLLAKRVPWVLSVYLNPEITDVSAAREMVRTVEDPNRRINRQLAHWIRARDLVVRGTNVAEALPRIDRPLLCVVANGDGIVPRATAVFPAERVGSRIRAILDVGGEDLRLAHADMFISRAAHERVFAPIARWLARPSSDGAALTAH